MIKLFNPLFSLYYSATHKEKHSLMYQLSPNEAYNQRLVKKIQVISLTTQANQNNIDIACTTVENDQAGKLYAKLLLQIRLIDGTFKTKEIKVKKGDLLEEKTKNPSYRGMRVGNMNRGISVVIEQ
ncbi:MAG: hypothetical protein LBH96_02180 [Candidatus Peribacteria bacterium]|jgi:type III restriction enzyme|nr:hypothetical protein [Candidatus Peribacteria bacterium]